VKAEPIVDVVFTDHARFEMGRRGLSEDVVRGVLSAPGQRWSVRPGREVVQSQVSMGEAGRPYVVRVFVDIDRTPCEVVTAYRTSRIAKYWRPEP
jgi:hypothetical protein